MERCGPSYNCLGRKMGPSFVKEAVHVLPLFTTYTVCYSGLQINRRTIALCFLGKPSKETGNWTLETGHWKHL